MIKDGSDATTHSGPMFPDGLAYIDLGETNNVLKNELSKNIGAIKSLNQKQI